MGVGVSKRALPRAFPAVSDRVNPQKEFITKAALSSSLVVVIFVAVGLVFGSRYLVGRCDDPESPSSRTPSSLLSRTSSGFSCRYSNSAKRFARSGFRPLVGKPLLLSSFFSALAGNDKYSLVCFSMRGSKLPLLLPTERPFRCCCCCCFCISSSCFRVRSRASLAEISSEATNSAVVVVNESARNPLLLSRLPLAGTKASVVDMDDENAKINSVESSVPATTVTPRGMLDLFIVLVLQGR
mmetsp:Transcript_27991/g.61667  ORF Transcript_27991/g.61667 Transcript_27991/m.61667 type:complete len:241 (-) Transcript_27991:120-842(-)